MLRNKKKKKTLAAKQMTAYFGERLQALLEPHLIHLHMRTDAAQQKQTLAAKQMTAYFGEQLQALLEPHLRAFSGGYP